MEKDHDPSSQAEAVPERSLDEFVLGASERPEDQIYPGDDAAFADETPGEREDETRA